MPPLRLPATCCLAALLFAAPLAAPAQELREEVTPFSVWLDFRALASARPPRISLPIWLESVQIQSTAPKESSPGATVFRLRFRRLGDLNEELQLRLFFDDQKDTAPVITGWSETGTVHFKHGPIGTGLGLPTSETLALAMSSVDYIDIATRGDGASLRGVYLATLRKDAVRHPLDFPLAAEMRDAFDNPTLAEPKAEDSSLYGRVRATIDPGVLKLAPIAEPRGKWEFDLQTPPLIAVVTFEILNGDPLAPPEVIINDRPLGPATILLPDLADPAYLGHVRPLDRDMRFRYTGWLRGQKAIPGSALLAGPNGIVLQLHKESGPVAIRAVELQLKHNWQSLDYTLSPDPR